MKNSQDPGILDKQHAHWENMFSHNAELFGSAPGHPAMVASKLFHKHGAQTMVELGAGQGRDALFVLPSRWRNGIGRKLLSHLFAEHEKLELAVYRKNQRAVTFYTRM